MKDAMWKTCMCKSETQRLSSTEELGRCACLTMFASICICVSCLYASIINSAKQWIAKICVVSTYTFTTSLLQVLKWPGYALQEAVHLPSQHWIYTAVCCTLSWKMSMREQKRNTAFWRYTVTFLIVKLWREKTTSRDLQQKMSKQ